jgi:hypothetical protein
LTFLSLLVVAVVGLLTAAALAVPVVIALLPALLVAAHPLNLI